MFRAGVDVGQHGVKVVVLGDEGVVSQTVLVTERDSDSGARTALEECLRQAGLSEPDLHGVCATGLGRKEVSFAHRSRTQETCAARGAFHLLGRPCTVLDAGAGGCRAVRVGPGGRVLDFAGNSKCAGGTGSFLEAACEVLHMDLQRLDVLAGSAHEVARVSTTCAVFAESAIISNIHYGFSLESICAGVCDSLTSRLMDVLNRVGVQEELFFCGGVAQSLTVRRMLEHILKIPVRTAPDPLTVAALGAALSAVQDTER